MKRKHSFTPCYWVLNNEKNTTTTTKAKSKTLTPRISLLSLPLTTRRTEFHHIHHASTRVPCYFLSRCHDEGESRFGKGWSRAGVNRVGVVRAFKSFFHSLFHSNKVEKEGEPIPKFVSFEPYQSLGLHD